MLISLVIPARNEEKLIVPVAQKITEALRNAGISYECIVLNDGSTDQTGPLLDLLAQQDPCVKVVHRKPPHGVGWAIREGLQAVTGEGVIIAMGDGSDDPKDVVQYAHLLQKGYDCVLGSRFRPGSQVLDYPKLKLALNRLGNFLVQVLFWLPYNDVTNAFKAYRTQLVRSIPLLLSTSFEINLELPLQVLRLSRHPIEVPIRWMGRSEGQSKLAIWSESARYFIRLLMLRFGPPPHAQSSDHR